MYEFQEPTYLVHILASNIALYIIHFDASRQSILKSQHRYFVTKIVLTHSTVRKNCPSDREKTFCREFAKFLRSLEQFIQTVKGQNNFW